jgi:hypothetical protein
MPATTLRRVAPMDSLAPTGGEGWGEGAIGELGAGTLTRLAPAERATLSRGAGEGLRGGTAHMWANFCKPAYARPHRRFEAIRAPSAIACSFFNEISGSSLP